MPDHCGECCLPIRYLITADVAANAGRARARRRDVFLGLLWARGVQAALLHRLAHAAWRRGLTPISELLLRGSQLLFGVDISYRATIGPGLILRHCMNVVIGSEAALGRNVCVFQGVTIGKRLSGSVDRPDGMATVQDHVILGAGCVLLGPIVVGHHSTVGANAVVTRDVEPHSLVTGV